MASVLVPRPRAAPLEHGERARLDRVLGAGMALLPHMGAWPPERVHEASARVYRRFVLEALLALRSAPGGELRANALGRAMGARGQSFANKARELAAMGAVERLELGGAPAAVSYRLTPKGEALGSMAFALTAFKAEQCRSALAGDPAPPFAALAGPPAPAPDPARALASLLEGARELVPGYLAPRGGPAGPGAAELRRYAGTCVRRWHGEVLSTLAERGPLRFAELREATGAGNEALAQALRSLEALRAVRRDAPLWVLTPWGLGDLALGAPVCLVAGDLMAAAPAGWT